MGVVCREGEGEGGGKGARWKWHGGKSANETYIGKMVTQPRNELDGEERTRCLGPTWKHGLESKR